MGLFSFFRKDKQKGDSASEASYVSRSATDTMRQRSQRNTSKNEAKSPDVPENRRARRRLVGAIVLVLAIVIILPRIFDSKPNPHQDIALQIPDQAKADHAIDVPTNPVQNSAQSSGGNVATAPNANVTVDNDTEEEVVSSAPSKVPATPAPVQTPAPVASAPAVSSPVMPNNTAPAVTSPTPAPAIQQAPAVKKTPEPVTKQSTPKPAPAPSKAKDDAAESARALAILEGKSPAKTADKSASSSSNSTNTSSDTRKFVVQVAALSDPAKVAALRQRLSSAGISSFTQQIKTSSGETTRIRVGPFNGKDAAETMRVKINRLGLNASVMPA